MLRAQSQPRVDERQPLPGGTLEKVNAFVARREHTGKFVERVGTGRIEVDGLTKGDDGEVTFALLE